MEEKCLRKQYFNNIHIAHKIRCMRFLPQRDPSELYENPLSNFDMDVADSIYTIFKNMYELTLDSSPSHIIPVTTADILHVLSGNFNQRLTAALKEKIEKSVETLRHTDIEILKARKSQARFLLYAHDENDEITSVPEKEKYNMYYHRPFLQLEGGNGNYNIKINSIIEDTALSSFFPLYAYAFRNYRQFVEFDPILLSYEADIQMKDGQNTGGPGTIRRHQRTTLYIQIRRELIRRIEWSRYHLSGEIYFGRDVSEREGAQFVSHKKDIPAYGHGKSVGKARIIYLRMPHRTDAGIKKQGGTGLLPKLGFLPQSQEKRSAWREKKRSVHHEVCLILDTFKEMDYIDGYRNIMAPAPYRKRVSSNVPAPVFHFAKTRLEQKRLEKGIGRAAFCKAAMNWPESDLVKDGKGRKNRLVDRLQQYEWNESDTTFTDREWKHFAEKLECLAEDIKEPLSSLETARIKCGCSQEELAEELIYYDIAHGYFGNYDDEEAESLKRKTEQPEPTITDWLEEIAGLEKQEGTSFIEKYNYHLNFIRNEERLTAQLVKLPRLEKRENELKNLTEVLNGLLPDDQIHLRKRRQNMTLYGVEIYGVATPSEWSQQLQKLYHRS